MALLAGALLLLSACPGAPQVTPPPPDPAAATARAQVEIRSAAHQGRSAADAEANARAAAHIQALNVLNTDLEAWLDATRAAVPRTRAADLASLAALADETRALRAALAATAARETFQNRPLLRAWEQEVDALLRLWEDLHIALQDGDVGAADLAYEALIETWLSTVSALEALAPRAVDAAFWLP